MELNFKLNGKTLLGIALLSATVAVADFVSVANVKDAGGVNMIVNPIEDTIEKIMPVGTVVFRIDGQDPSVLYGGKWQIIHDDATIAFGDGSAQTGLADDGVNNPVVPVQEHNHTGSIGSKDLGTKYTNYAGTHSHNYTTHYGTGESQPNNRLSRSYTLGTALVKSGAISSSGNHRHSVVLGSHNHSVSIANSGTANATLDVRGKRIKINVWQRIE